MSRPPQVGNETGAAIRGTLQRYRGTLEQLGGPRLAANDGGTGAAASAAPRPRQGPSPHVVLQLYPLKPRFDEVPLVELAVNRARKNPNTAAVAIDDINDIFILLDVMAEQ